MKEQEILDSFSLTREEVEEDADVLEDEQKSDDVIGPVTYGFHARDRADERMVTISLRLPQTLLDKANNAARRYHISRSEYLRRKLADAKN